MFICKQCNKECPTYEFLRKHVGRVHKIPAQETWVTYMNNGLHPSCKCGCGEFVRWRAGKYQEYVNGHNSRGEANPMFGKVHTSDAKKNISLARKEKFANGEYRIWQNEDTEDTRERFKKIGEMSTKENNPGRARKISIALTGKRHSESHNKNSREAITRAWENPELRERQRYNRIKYLQANQFAKPSKLENNFASLLDTLKIKFDRQVPISGYLYDFLIIGTNILVEVDGDFYHCNPDTKYATPVYEMQHQNVNNDRAKNLVATDNNYKLLRFWESDIHNNPAQVIKTLLDAIEESK